jgi:hypothetical protein
MDKSKMNVLRSVIAVNVILGTPLPINGGTNDSFPTRWSSMLH